MECCLSKRGDGWSVLRRRAEIKNLKLRGDWNGYCEFVDDKGRLVVVSILLKEFDAEIHNYATSLLAAHITLFAKIKGAATGIPPQHWRLRSQMNDRDVVL